MCPANKGKDCYGYPEMEPDPDTEMPELIPMLTLSNKGAKNRAGKLAGAWRGKKPLQRNAKIALENLHDRSAVPDLLEVIDTDPRPMSCATAAWAVSELAATPNAELTTALEKAQAKETTALAQAEC